QQMLRRQVSVPTQSLNQTRFTEFFALRVERLGDSVGVEHHGVSGKEIPLTRAAIPTLEKSQDGAGRIEALQIAVPTKQKRRKMTAVCIAQASQAVVVLSEKESGKGAVGGILVKKPMYRQQKALGLTQDNGNIRAAGISRRLTAKMGLQTRHQQSSSNSFSHNVAYHQSKLVPAELKEVVKIPANLASLDADRRIFQGGK